jgi:hypothetical protein
MLPPGGRRVARDVGLEAHQLAVDQGKALAHAVEKDDELCIGRAGHGVPPWG